MQGVTSAHCRAAGPGAVVVLKAQRGLPSVASCLQSRPIRCRQRRQAVATAAARAEAGSSSGSAAVAAAAAGRRASAEAGLLQRLLANSSLSDRGTLLLAAALGGCMLLGAAEPALAAAAAQGKPASGPQLLGDLSENADFWGNVLRYVSYFFSVLLGTAYIAIKPILELLKRPTTAVLVVAGIAGLVYFVSFTVQAMLGITEPLDYTASSIVTPMS